MKRSSQKGGWVFEQLCYVPRKGVMAKKGWLDHRTGSYNLKQNSILDFSIVTTKCYDGLHFGASKSFFCPTYYTSTHNGNTSTTSTSDEVNEDNVGFLTSESQ